MSFFKSNKFSFLTNKLLTKNIPIISENMTVAEAEADLLNNSHKYDTISSIYLVDKDNKYKGAIPIIEIFRSPKNKKLFNITTTLKKNRVYSHNSQKTAIHLALKHDIKNVPVVDQEENLLGVIKYNNLLKSLHHKFSKDLIHFGGSIHPPKYDDIFKLSLMQSLKHRIPWLILGLLGGIITSKVIDSYEVILYHNIILASFLPLIVYMADAVGTQMEAFIIRDLAIDPELNFNKYFFHQLIIVVSTGIILSILTYIVTISVYKNTAVSFVVACSLFAAIITSVFSGLIFPFIFYKFNFDPANASGPIATIFQDLISVIIYFSLAVLIL